MGIKPNEKQESVNPASPDELLAMLTGLGIPYQEHRHEAVFTVEEAKGLRGALPGAHCKSLFIRDKKGASFLVVCLEDRRLDMKALAGPLGAKRLSFASPDRLRDRLGVEPGSVTPFATINDHPPQQPGENDAPFHRVTVILDAEMMQTDLVNYHPLINTATIALSPAGLLRFLEATGHEPVIVDLSAATAGSASV
jgi:Ala-tRNA(Pro) deacylase